MISMDVVKAQPLLSTNPPVEPGLVSAGIPYGLRPSGAKVQSVCIQKLSRCFRQTESVIICSIIITVKSLKEC